MDRRVACGRMDKQFVDAVGLVVAGCMLLAVRSL